MLLRLQGQRPGDIELRTPEQGSPEPDRWDLRRSPSSHPVKIPLSRSQSVASSTVAQAPHRRNCSPGSTDCRASPIRPQGCVGEEIAANRASHTGRYTPAELDYYELFDVFEGNFRRNAATVFPRDP